MAGLDGAHVNDEERSRRVRRWTIVLVLVALAFYVGFIVSGVFKAG